MPFHLQIIASVDENSISTAAILLGDRNATPPSRPIVYVSREQCIQHKLRNTVVALTLPGAGPDQLPLYASVKVYSKESALFRKGSQFPDKLVAQPSETGSSNIWPVVVSNLLWWEIEQHTSKSASKEFCEDIGMPTGHAPVAAIADVVNKLGSATSITLSSLNNSNNSVQPKPNSAAIAQSLSGFVTSLHGWIVFKSPYGTHLFKIVQITTVGSDRPDVATMSDTTVVKYASPNDTPSASSDKTLQTHGGLTSKKQWLSSVSSVIGGYDDVLGQMIDQLYGFIEGAIHGSNGGVRTESVSLSRSRSCFQASFKGILISGKPGTGKSALASSLAQHSGLPYSIINYAGASENYLRDAFSSLLSRGRASILILDEVDMIASGRASRKGVEAKLFATLLNLIDAINMRPTGSKVFVIALTNRLHAVDASLVRSGRLDKVFDLHLKGVHQRLQVLQILSKDLPMDPQKRPEILQKVAKATHGFVPTDLQALCTECALILISKMAAGTASDKIIDFSYFAQALKTIRPSGMGEFLSKIPTVTFNDLFGIQDAIADLKVSIIEPFHNPGKYIDMGIAPPRGLLVHGPPGVGKTMLCCALAEELGINFMLVESSQIRSKVVGESEQNIAKMFAQAKSNAPCILFIDQIDVLAPSRGSTHTTENSGDRIVTGLLTEMDGFFSGSSGKGAEVDVLVLAATNRPEVIDSAILRPGRLDQIVHIPVPDEKARQSILEGYTSKMPLRISPEEMRELAKSTEGYSGADLENLCREAALICLREDITNTEGKFMIADL
ncbi:hypothetical protein BGZ80_000724 [Entomortierella chlamydospora]|uniref:AAA+ ATPase domain-containing protein n=1 Tax=Entomortierella chlamydospora TaxID=101097 RepID=A0A9P6MT03_9FUNG|nr:hypothetical protein BGZ80_000724 [Entomortierella chlamydospora]